MGQKGKDIMILPGVSGYLLKYMNKKDKARPFEQYAKSLLLAKQVDIDQYNNLLKLGKVILLNQHIENYNKTPKTHPNVNLSKFLLEHLDLVSALVSFERSDLEWSELAKWAIEVGSSPATLFWFYLPYFFQGRYVPPSGYFDPIEGIKNAMFTPLETRFYRLPISGIELYEVPPILHSFDHLNIFYFMTGPCMKTADYHFIDLLGSIVSVDVSVKRLAKRCNTDPEVLSLAFNVLKRNIYIFKFLRGLGIKGYVGQWIPTDDCTQCNEQYTRLERVDKSYLDAVLVECVKSQVTGKCYARVNIVNLLDQIKPLTTYRRVNRTFRHSLKQALESVGKNSVWRV